MRVVFCVIYAAFPRMAPPATKPWGAAPTHRGALAPLPPPLLFRRSRRASARALLQRQCQALTGGRGLGPRMHRHRLLNSQDLSDRGHRSVCDGRAALRIRRRGLQLPQLPFQGPIACWGRPR